MSPEGLNLIGRAGVQIIEEQGWQADAIGGLTLGADPVAYAISYTSVNTSHPLRAFTVRKELKKHGTRRLIEGPFRAGDRTVIVEDVITTGTSALLAIDAVQDAHGIIVGVLAVVDREEGGREAIQKRGVPVVALASMTMIRSMMPANG